MTRILGNHKERKDRKELSPDLNWRPGDSLSEARGGIGTVPLESEVRVKDLN